MKKRTNPNKANQHTPDERQEICWNFYIESINAGKPNAQASAIKAGYEESSAQTITVNSWFLERLAKLKRKDMLSKAERNLDKALDFDMHTDEGKINTQVASLVIDVSKTLVKTLGKDEGYSDRTEHTGKNGGAIEIEGVEISIRK